MVSAMPSKFALILVVCFCINIAVADPRRLQLHGRDGPTIPSTAVSDTSTVRSENAAQTTTSGVTSTIDPSITSVPSLNSTSVSGSITSKSSSASTSASAIISNLNGASPTSVSNNSGFNSTLTPNTLPITPEITPGFSVVGVILILSGAAYTIIGLKNKWLHISVSAAYLGSLAITVLVIYVMNPPVSHAIQGAYVVAAVITGLILGGLSLIFTEMTEGLGCLFGGFCFSMWLLVLQPGGTLKSTGSKSALIAAFTIAIFSTSFSHYTRPYGLIFSISFGGATALVMGIDCFSRAGLKEFWAYLWNLNDTLFPLGATTYPLTRGIKVEIAAIVIIFLAGIVSQMKLWKIIKEAREKRALERLEDERNMQKEEENVGRRIEHANAKERDQWEAVYGDKDASNKSSGPSIRDSGVGDMDSQKKGPLSTVTSLRQSGEDEIELSDMPSPTLTTGAGLVMMNQGREGGPVTVRVARDLEPTPESNENPLAAGPDQKRSSRVSENQQDEQTWVVGADGEARLEKRLSQRNSKRVSATSPEVVPLPFKIPEGEHEDDRSSVATFADEEPTTHHRVSRHLSAGIEIVRKLSHRSHRSSQRNSFAEGQSTEDLVIPRGDIEDDRASSVAATMDGLSDDDDMRSIRSSIDQAPDTTEAARIPDITTTGPESGEPANPESVPTGRISKDEAVTDQTTAQEPEPADQGNQNTDNTKKPDIEQSLTSSTDPKPKNEDVTQEEGLPEGVKSAPSTTSAIESKPASITKDRLPAQLSKVVMSYRTNEWAKHLSQADAPQVEELKLAEYPTDTQPTQTEKAVPVNVEELQQTATSASPQISRAASQMSNYASVPLTGPVSSEQKNTVPSRADNVDIQDNNLMRSASQLSQTNRGMSFRSTSSPQIPHQIVESPVEDQFPPSTPAFIAASKLAASSVPYGAPSTLMGRRDTMVRNKTAYYANQQAFPATPEVQPQFASHYNSANVSRTASDAGSLYNYSMSTPVPDDDNMSLSARRNLIRQSSLHNTSPFAPPLLQTPVPFDSHQPKRQSSAPSQLSREQMLANWRASVQNDLQSAVVPKVTIERQRSALWQEKEAEAQRRALEERMKGARDVAFDQMMRRGDMLDAHREALRRMQASANKHA